MIYTKDIRVEFNHCDPAGIVFYPRYFEMFNSVIENFFADVLGLPFAMLDFSSGSGVPLVDVQARFSLPTRLNDVLRFALAVEEIGRSSLRFQIRGLHGETERLSVHLVVVWMEKGKSHTWPPDLKRKIVAFMESKDVP